MGRVRTYVGQHHLGLVAIFIALSGTAYAAAELEKNDVASRHVKNGGVKTKDLANDAVTSPKVADGSLLAGDFAPDQLPAGPEGPRGPEGPQGQQGQQGLRGPQGEPGMSQFEFRSAVTDYNSESPKEISIDCPANTYVIGAFHDVAGGKTGAAPSQIARVIVDKMLPTASNGVLSQRPTRVYLQAFESEAIPDNWSLRAGVTCAAISPTP